MAIAGFSLEARAAAQSAPGEQEEEKKLEEAVPVHSETSSASATSQAALKGLKKTDLTSLASMLKPPTAVGQLFEVVLPMLGEENSDWSHARELIRDFDGFV